MAVLATVEYNKGEQFPVEATFDVTLNNSGTGALAGVIAGSTFSVRDNQGAFYQAMQNLTGVRAEVDPDGLTGRVYYDLNTGPFDPGIYYGQFSFMPVGTDLVIRILEPTIRIKVTAPVAVIATFNINTLGGLVRLYCRDTDMLNPILDDDTINAMIAQSGYSGSSSDIWRTLTNIQGMALISAANCLDLMARDAAKIALIEKIGAISENTKVTYDALRDEANLLRSRAIQNFVPSDVTCDTALLDFVPFSLPITDYGNGFTIPRSTLDRW